MMSSLIRKLYQFKATEEELKLQQGKKKKKESVNIEDQEALLKRQSEVYDEQNMGYQDDAANELVRSYA